MLASTPAHVDRSRLAGPPGMSRGGAYHFSGPRGGTWEEIGPKGLAVRDRLSEPLLYPGEDQGRHVAGQVALDHRHHLVLLPHHAVQLQHRHPIR